MIREIAWTQDVHERLEHPAAADALPFLRREVEAGVSQLWECQDDGRTLYVVTRLDRNPDEWVMCYARGSGAVHFGREFVALADRKGWRMRAHTTNPAVERLTRRLGFQRSEIVMRR
jgi:hypothetical protein